MNEKSYQDDDTKLCILARYLIEIEVSSGFINYKVYGIEIAER